MTDAAPRLRASRSRAAALIPTTIGVALAALAFGTLDATRASTSTASPAPSSSRPPGAYTTGSEIVLKLTDGTATATLTDSAAAEQFAALLPLQLTLHDPMGQAKSGRLTTALDVSDEDRVLGPEVAGLYYWPPSGDLAVFYDDLDQTVPPPGLVRIGTVTTGLPVIASAGRRFTASIEVS